VQRRVGEHRVELVRERQRLAVQHLHRDAARTRRLRQLLAGIGAEHRGAGLDELLGQGAVAATQVEDALAAPGREPFDHRCAEVGHEPAVVRISLRVPLLAGRRPLVDRVHEANSQGASMRRRVS
jgi:hypothetical protein